MGLTEAVTGFRVGTLSLVLSEGGQLSLAPSFTCLSPRWL